MNSYPQETSSKSVYKTPTKHEFHEEVQNNIYEPENYSRTHHYQSYHEDYKDFKQSPIRNFQTQIKKSPYPEKNVMDLMKSTTSIQYKNQEINENYSEIEENEKVFDKSMRIPKQTKNYLQIKEEKGVGIPIAYEEFMNTKHKKILKENNQEKINEDILNILIQLNREKSNIEEKLAELEKRLSESETINENLQYEKEKLKSELMKIYQEVQVAKSGLKNVNLEETITQNSSNKKNNNSVNEKEKESNLKTEIKFLINKLLKAKGKLVKEKNDLSFKESAFKSGNNTYLNTSNYETLSKNNRTSEKKPKSQYIYDNPENVDYSRSKTPVIYKESRKKDYLYVKENVKQI